MTKRFQKLLVAALLLTLASCAAIIPKEHLIPTEKLTNTLQKQFPLHWEKAGGLLKITIDEPLLALNPDQNRVGIKGHFLAHAALLDIDGEFTSSSTLQYDPRQRAVFLQGVSLDSLHLKQGNNLAEIIRLEINRILNKYATNHPVYRFGQDELTIIGVKVDVESIAVLPNGIMLHLQPL